MTFKYPVSAKLVIKGSKDLPDGTECTVNHRVIHKNRKLYHCTLFSTRTAFTYIDEEFLVYKCAIDFNKDLAELLK